MISIRKLKEELAKFDDDCVCYAYEGEVTGLIIERKGDRLKSQGFIHCSESDDTGKETQTLDG